MTRAYACGFETGDTSQLFSVGAGCTVQSSIVRSGGFAFSAVNASSTFTQNLNTTQSVCRYYAYFKGTFPATLGRERCSGPANRLQLLILGSNLRVSDAAATLGLTAISGSAVLVPGQIYRIEVVLNLAAGGIIQVWVNGVLDINTTHTNDVSATPTIGWTCVGMNAPNEVIFDDVAIDVDTLTLIGDDLPPAHVPFSIATGSTTNPAGTYSLTTTQIAPRGSVILVGTSMANQDGGAVSQVGPDSAGNVYAKVASIGNPVSGKSWTDVWACLNTTANLPIGGTIPVTYGSTGNRAAVICVPSIGAVAAIDVNINALSTGASPPTALVSGLLNHDSEILIGIGESTVASPVYTPNAGFTPIVTSVSTIQAVHFAYQNVADRSSKTWQPTWTGATDVWTTILLGIQTGADAVTGPSSAPFTGGGNGMLRQGRRYIQSSPKPTGPSPAERQKALTATLRKAAVKTAPIVVGLASTPEISYFTNEPPVADIFMPAPDPRPAISLVTDEPLVLPAREPVKPPPPKPEPDEDDEEVMALMGL